MKARAGHPGRALEGRRPVRLRPRRRGGARRCARRASLRGRPGVTAALAAPAYAGIPVTQRGHGERRRLRHGHEDPEEARDSSSTGPRWPRSRGRSASTWASARSTGDRGAARGGRAARGRARGGRPMRGTYGGPALRGAGTLADIAGKVVARRASRRRRSRSSAEVAALHDELRLAAGGAAVGRADRRGDPRAGAGQRRRGDPCGGPGRHGGRGARDPHRAARRPKLPALAHLRPRRLHPSSTTVRQLFAHVPRRAGASRGATVAAIGPGTAGPARRAASSRGHRAERAVAEALVAELTTGPWRRVLIPRAAHARDVLPDGLRSRGAHVDVLPLYRTVAEPLEDAARAGRAGRGLPPSPVLRRHVLPGGGGPPGARADGHDRPDDLRRRSGPRLSSPTSRPPSTPRRARRRTLAAAGVRPPGGRAARRLLKKPGLAAIAR